MTKILDNLEIVVEGGCKRFRCAKCGQDLGDAREGYRGHALKGTRPLSFGQPAVLVPEVSRYVLREYYCPGCGCLMEVETAFAGSAVVESIRLE